MQDTRRARPVKHVLDRVFSPHLIKQLQLTEGKEVEKELVDRWRGVLARLLPLGGASQGNNVQVFFDSAQAWRAKWDAIGIIFSRHFHLLVLMIFPPNSLP